MHTVTPSPTHEIHSTEAVKQSEIVSIWMCDMYMCHHTFTWHYACMCVCVCVCVWVFFGVENELIITGDWTTCAVVGENCLILPLLHRPFFLVRWGLATPQTKKKTMKIGKQATKQLESVVGSRNGERRAVTRQSIRIGTWNVQTFVNADGPVQTAARSGQVRGDKK